MLELCPKKTDHPQHEQREKRLLAVLSRWAGFLWDAAFPSSVVMPPRQTSVPCERTAPDQSMHQHLTISSGSGSSSSGSSRDNDNSNNTAPTQEISPGTTNAKSPLLARAEHVAQAMLEISLHRLARQADRQQKDLAALCEATAGDGEYRARNERRLAEMYGEIVAVKEQYRAVRERQGALGVDAGKLQAEADEIRREMGSGIASLRAELLELSKRVKALLPHANKKIQEEEEDDDNDDDDEGGEEEEEEEGEGEEEEGWQGKGTEEEEKEDGEEEDSSGGHITPPPAATSPATRKRKREMDEGERGERGERESEDNEERAGESQESIGKSTHQTRTRAPSKQPPLPPDPKLIRDAATTSPRGSVGERIDRFMSRTRDWHQARRGSEAPEAAFCENYFRRQAKHDAAMARLVQRALLQRVGGRSGSGSGSGATRPRSLQELCGAATWDGVMKVVEEVLVHNRERTVGLLA